VIAFVWRYVVRPEHFADFERTYGPSGAWARLFAEAEGYQGTELLRDGEGRYLTIDRWRDAADFDAFMGAHRAAYQALDAQCDAWTLHEERVGDTKWLIVNDI